MFPTQSSEAGGRSHVTEVVRPDQDTFEDGVGLSVKPIGHGFVGGGGPNTKGGIDSKGEDTNIP